MLTDKELEEIRRKMLELEEEPPMGGWRSIQAEVVQPKKDWRPLWWLLPLLLLLLTGLGTYHMQNSIPDTDKTINKQVGTVNVAAPPNKANTDDVQRPALVTKQPASRVEDAQPIIRSRTTSMVPERQVVRQIVPEPTATATEGEVTAAAVGRNRPDIPVIALLPHRNTVFATPLESIDPKKHTIAVKNVIRDGAAGLIEAHQVAIETTKAESLNETTTTKQNIAVETTTAKSINPEEQLQISPADTASLAASPAAATVPAKEEKKKRPPLEKRISSINEWTVGVYFAPRYAFRKFLPNATDDILITGVRNVNQLDPKRMGYEFGANFSKVLKPGLFVEGGLNWMQLKENVTYTLTTGKIDTFSVRQLNGGPIVVESKLMSEERQLISSYAYGGLRLGVTQYFLERGNRRFNVTVAGGANLLLKGETKQFSNGEWTETVVFPSKENILEQSNYNLQVGVGYNVSVLGNYELMLMPTMSYFLGSTFKEREPLGLRPYSLGVNVQLKRRFNL
ncbi:porin family protein [Pontibacter pamirensis]|uniref:hypothetical protein n=1 Tax=Pontibacter pamirensis TaxID=2562824 RepID=UPI0013894E8F|nr:hypothetical protein [Pontibacter pamirensis]